MECTRDMNSNLHFQEIADPRFTSSDPNMVVTKKIHIDSCDPTTLDVFITISNTHSLIRMMSTINPSYWSGEKRTLPQDPRQFRTAPLRAIRAPLMGAPAVRSWLTQTVQIKSPEPILRGRNEQHLIDQGKPDREIAMMNLHPCERLADPIQI